jgi:hypothetical protein
LKRNAITLIALILFLTACHTAKTDAQKSTVSQEYKSIAVEKYGNNIEYVLNNSKTHVICLKQNKPTPQFPQNQISFFVYDLAKEEIILEESLIDGEVSWKNDREIQVKMTPGMLTTDEEYNKQLTGYIFDVKERKKL